MKKRKFLMIILILIIADQISKYFIEINKYKLPKVIINNILSFTYCKNKGVAFGIGYGKVGIITIITIIVIIVALILIIKNYKKINKLILIGIAMMISGGIGNLIDRIFRAYVVDFIDFRIIDFPIFNIADICVVVGVIIVGITYLKLERSEKIDKNNC